jgi:hypothetical protein
MTNNNDVWRWRCKGEERGGGSTPRNFCPPSSSMQTLFNSNVPLPFSVSLCVILFCLCYLLSLSVIPRPYIPQSKNSQNSNVKHRRHQRSETETNCNCTHHKSSHFSRNKVHFSLHCFLLLAQQLLGKFVGGFVFKFLRIIFKMMCACT